MRLHGIPHSTNVERVALALGLKGLDVERVDHDRGDRSAIRAVSGQDLVPVLETADGQVFVESIDIVAWIDATWPEPALYPHDASARREVDGFITFFDRVWKVPPNAIEAERRKPAGAGDEARVAAWTAQLEAWRHGFDALLHGRDYLFGDRPGAADICAYPFLRFGLGRRADDDDPFHEVLVQTLRYGSDVPRLCAWIARMDRIPRA